MGAGFRGWARDERKRNDAGASDQPEGDDPFVANGIDPGANKCNGYDQVSKRKPVSAVGKKRITAVRVRECLVDTLDPWEQLNGFGDRSQPARVKEMNKTDQVQTGEGRQ